MQKQIWKSSFEKLKSTKWIAIMGLLLALRVVVSRFSLPVAESLNISFSFLFVGLSGAILGPSAGIVFAIVEDLVEFALFNSQYGFFAGYTLSAALGILCYALCLYDQKITVSKIVLAKFLSTYPVTVCLGSYWRYLMLGSKGYWVYFTQSLIKNTIMFPIQIILFIILFNVLLPYLSSRRYLKPQKAPIPLY